jgi:hypothetical protein
LDIKQLNNNHIRNSWVQPVNRTQKEGLMDEKKRKSRDFVIFDFAKRFLFP